ncbi:GGDEF domain-containing protein [Acinetobacter tianfuensis]|uniref:diguanylate cyclase n=1 Tax=Acinetobacter tianfuensis TaxID=2419603 RepID=A0A3A8E827_9GAMM|nr:GGDEF domain-containing protein [Acinetobacter tianfuensis]RKG30329.1 GGDEF domain-containing protein [Acinetobacter tianfuensis]
MEYKYKLAKLQYDKEKIEELIAQQSSRVGQVFPKKMEEVFWQKNLERSRKHIEKNLWSGVLVYFLFILVMIPTDYWIIDKNFFKQDFIQCVLGLTNGAFTLMLIYFAASLPKLKPYFVFTASAIFFWAIVSMSWLTLTIQTEDLKHQALVIICIIDILGFMLIGLKPFHMLTVSMLASFSAIVLLVFTVDMNPLLLGRVLLGGCFLGFVISHMGSARERMIYLYTSRAKISEQIHRIHNSELLHLSQHDALTNISNRRTFDETLTDYFNISKREESPLAVLFIDVDHFKNFNDFYGHQKGDDVISSIAESIKNAIRHMDFVARYGGEEFVVLLPETNAHGAYAVASNIYKAIDRLGIPHEKSLVSNHITISLGITVYRGEEMTQDELLCIADQALYRAKQLGRNQIYYQSIRSEAASL